MLGPCNRCYIETKYRQFNLILDQVRALRDFQELCVLESFTKLAHKSPFNLILSLSSLIVSMVLLLEDFGCELSLCGLLSVTIFIDQEVWRLELILALSLSLILSDFALSSKLFLKLVVSLHLPDVFHELNALAKDLSRLTGLGDVGEVFVKLVEVLLEIGIFSLFWQVHEQVKNSLLAIRIE